jgi:hypothetical protein
MQICECTSCVCLCDWGGDSGEYILLAFSGSRFAGGSLVWCAFKQLKSGRHTDLLVYHWWSGDGRAPSCNDPYRSTFKLKFVIPSNSQIKDSSTYWVVHTSAQDFYDYAFPKPHPTQPIFFLYVPQTYIIHSQPSFHFSSCCCKFEIRIAQVVALPSKRPLVRILKLVPCVIQLPPGCGGYCTSTYPSLLSLPRGVW